MMTHFTVGDKVRLRDATGRIWNAVILEPYIEHLSTPGRPMASVEINGRVYRALHVDLVMGHGEPPVLTPLADKERAVYEADPTRRYRDENLRQWARMVRR